MTSATSPAVRIGTGQFRASAGTEDWRVLGEGALAHFRTGSFGAGVRLVQAISQLPGLSDHRPDVDLRHDGVTVRLITIEPDYYGMSERDVELAGLISGLARELGATADPSAVQAVQVSIDALVHADVMPFWQAILGYTDRGGSPADLLDPRGRGPLFWFQQMDVPRPQRNRIHLDIWVPEDNAEARVEAAVAAGGRLLDAEHAPSYWILADPEGNEACVCTTM